MLAPDPDAGPELPEPTPAFRPWAIHGAVAIDEAGIRTDYNAYGVPRTSTVIVTLVGDGQSEPCNVRVVPAFVGFARRSMPNNELNVIQLDLGQGILGDGCGWDNDYMQAELAALGTVEIGWAPPAVAETWPRLDVQYDLGADAAPVVYSGAGSAWAMDADGVVSTERANMLPDRLDRGLYEL